MSSKNAANQPFAISTRPFSKVQTRSINLMNPKKSSKNNASYQALAALNSINKISES